METYSDEIMKVLATLNEVVDVRKYEDDFMTMVETNWKTERRRKGPRSYDVVKKNTAVGYGAEVALQLTGSFTPYAPITENAEGLTFAQRKRDVKCEDKIAEVKTMNSRYPVWYISGGQAESVMYSTRFNDLFLIMGYEEVKPLVYRYRPKFLIDSKRLPRYIVKANTGYSEYKFDHESAIRNGDCVDLWRVA